MSQSQDSVTEIILIQSFLEDFQKAYDSEHNLANLISNEDNLFFKPFSGYINSRLNISYETSDNLNEIRFICEYFFNYYKDHIWIILFLYWKKCLVSNDISNLSPYQQIDLFYKEFIFSESEKSFYDDLNKDLKLYASEVFLKKSEKCLREKYISKLMFTVFELYGLVTCFFSSEDIYNYLNFDLEYDESIFFLPSYCECTDYGKFSSIKESIIGSE